MVIKIQGPETEYLTPAEVSRLLRVNPRTLRGWADSGKIGCWITPGGHRRYPLAEVQKLRSALLSRGPARSGR